MSSILVRRANMVTAGSGPTPGRLPDGYTELAYLQSSGTQRINTGISGGSSTLEITCDFLWSSFTSYVGVYGNYWSEQRNATRCILSASDNKILVTNNSAASGGTTGADCTRGSRHTLVSSYGSFVVDGTSYTGSTTQGTANTRNIYLFSNYNNNMSDIGLRVYGFSIKNNGTKVLDLVPAMRDSDSEVGMYDLVNDTFLTNAGSGTFSYGTL